MASEFDKALEALPPRQARFVQQYLQDLNGMRAAIRAGYSPRSAQEQSSVLLSKPKVKAAVEAGKAKRAAKLELSAEFVVGELLKLASVDMSDAYDAEGNLKPLHAMPEPLRKAIARVDMGDGGLPRGITLNSKTRSLELLARHLGMLTDNLNVSGSLKTLTKDDLDARILALTGR